MWVDQISLIRVAGSTPPTEAQIAELLAPVLARSAITPAMVIDGRPATAKTGSTATYRLLTALGLVLAAPAAVSFVRPGAGYDAIDMLLCACPEGGPALVVATTAAAPYVLGACLASRTPIGTASVRPLRPPESVPDGAGPGGVLGFLAGAGTGDPFPIVTEKEKSRA
jgi:hypothetical protein